ncbi:uncharacterized protein LOC108737273 [Agrilus planipennis]|uniref:Uncharacterized protein LOC108737273 n=1 Tax=Agrilus planipennis TaxID=224129 RepID=A0A1W4WNK9_AGRPL|nr:uncharacterized protein LOC108737273 [Agrilus planipennis]
MIFMSNQVIFITLVQILDIQALIVPDEVPSILSIIYSNIPTIKKGTDSRLGYGFRLGDRADVQFLVELGPQTNTRPLANQPDKNGQNRKRSPPDDLIRELYSKHSDKKQYSHDMSQSRLLNVAALYASLGQEKQR